MAPDPVPVLSPSALEAVRDPAERDALARSVEHLERIMASLERALRQGDANQPARDAASR